MDDNELDDVLEVDDVDEVLDDELWLELLVELVLEDEDCDDELVDDVLEVELELFEDGELGELSDDRSSASP